MRAGGRGAGIGAKLYNENLPSGSVGFRLRSSPKEGNNLDDLRGRKWELGNQIKKCCTFRGTIPQQGKQGFDVNITVKARVLGCLGSEFPA